MFQSRVYKGVVFGLGYFTILEGTWEAGWVRKEILKILKFKWVKIGPLLTKIGMGLPIDYLKKSIAWSVYPCSW